MMTIGQYNLIENYSSLRRQTDSQNLAAMLEFCDLFKTNDVELFKQYRKSRNPNGYANIDKLIELYAKRYELDPEKDIEKIMYQFINNKINNGVVYHLNNSANFESIMELGLGLSAIGLKTEERKDYERLQNIIPHEIWRRLQPFHGEKSNVSFYYSTTPMPEARYGQKPEWLIQLEKNVTNINDYPEIQKIVYEVLEKYNKKYNNGRKMMFIIPYPLTLSESNIEEILELNTPKEIIGKVLYSLTSQGGRNASANSHIMGHNIIAIDLETLNLYYCNSNGYIESIDDYLSSSRAKK